MNGLRRLTCALLTTGAWLLAGCTTMQAYEGPKKASHETAVIKSNPLRDGAFVQQINGKNLGFIDGSVEVLPGLHSLTIRVLIGFGGGSKTISLEAKAGGTYRVNGKITKGEVYAWVEDEADGEIVAGKKPAGETPQR